MIKMTKEFNKELAELIRKHNLTMITAQRKENLELYRKIFSGKLIFISDGTLKK